MKSKKYLLLIFVLLPFLTTLAQVDTVWVRRYNGLENSDDMATAIAVDGIGNVYVTGNSQSGISEDYATIKYSSTGDNLWVRRYNGPGNFSDVPNALAVDNGGNVYVTGSSYGSGIYYDYATIKYSPSGDTLWVRRYNGSGNGHDEALALAVDASGNVYVTGYIDPGDGEGDYATIKYSSSGDTLWVRRYNGPGNFLDVATALAVDASGNVYVTGYSWSGTTYDYATIKYSTTGDTLWVRSYNGPGNFQDLPRALAVDASGNVYVTGRSWGSGTLDDYATIKYSSAGDTLWVRRYNGPGNGSDKAWGLAIDDNGNVYVTGDSDGDPTTGVNLDFASIKYSPAGDTLWVRRYNGPGNGDDLAYALAIDSSGKVCVTGGSRGIGTLQDYATIKYAPNGDSLGVRRYNGPGNSNDYAKAMAVDKCGYVYVTGHSVGSGTGPDYATIKYFPFPCTAKPGDVNASGNVSLVDLIYLYNYIFKGGPPPSPRCSGDVNADGNINMTDYIYLYNYIFYGGPAPIKCGECCL